MSTAPQVSLLYCFSRFPEYVFLKEQKFCPLILLAHNLIDIEENFVIDPTIYQFIIYLFYSKVLATNLCYLSFIPRMFNYYYNKEKALNREAMSSIFKLVFKIT